MAERRSTRVRTWLEKNKELKETEGNDWNQEEKLFKSNQGFKRINVDF